MKKLNLNEMECLKGGQMSSYDKCVIGSATTGAIAGAFVGGPVGLLGGWIFTGIGAMVGCAISTSKLSTSASTLQLLE
jgi:hypothetical protein